MTFITSLTEYYPVKSIDTSYNDDSGSSNEKQGEIIFGVCCDSRRAVIVVNLVAIVFDILGTFLMIFGIEMIASEGDLEDINEKTAEELAIAFVVIKSLIYLACYGIGLWGALYYERCGIITALCAHCFGLVEAVFLIDPFGMILSSCMIYPHYVLQKEIKEGIMTEDRYPQERHCC